jgi:hypothetical protein
LFTAVEKSVVLRRLQIIARKNSQLAGLTDLERSVAWVLELAQPSNRWLMQRLEVEHAELHRLHAAIDASLAELSIASGRVRRFEEASAQAAASDEAARALDDTLSALEATATISLPQAGSD